MEIMKKKKWRFTTSFLVVLPGFENSYCNSLYFSYFLIQQYVISYLKDVKTLYKVLKSIICFGNVSECLFLLLVV